MDGQLNKLEPHPAAEGARQWLIGYIQRNDAHALLRLQESFASCAIEGNRLAEICSETLRRLLNKEPVSDRYLLGLVWTIRDMEEKEAEGSRDDGLAKELAKALDDALDSLKYVQTAHPEASGRGVRAERIVKAEAVLARAGAAGLG